jgi:hypothetical protein
MTEPIYDDMTQGNWLEAGRRFMEDHAAKLEQEAGHLIGELTGHHGYHEPQQQAQPPEDPMSGSILEDVRNGVENALSWLKQVDETHLPAAEAEVAKVQNSAVAQALEGLVLTPGEEAFLTEIITKLPSLRVSEDAEEPAETPDDPSAPAGAPQPASGQPVAAGAAT